MAAILKIYFSLLLLFRKASFIQNLVGSIRVTCRSKIAEIVAIRNQDGRHGSHLENLFFASSPELKGQLIRNLVGNPKWPPWQPFWNSIFPFSPEPKGQSTRNLIGRILVTCRSKIIKIVPIRNQDGGNGGHLENLFFASSPEPKG